MEYFMGITNKIVDGQDTPGTDKYSGNTLLKTFGFNITGRKGNKGSNFTAKNVGRPCRAVCKIRPINMDANEAIS